MGMESHTPAAPADEDSPTAMTLKPLSAKIYEYPKGGNTCSRSFTIYKNLF